MLLEFIYCFCLWGMPFLGLWESEGRGVGFYVFWGSIGCSLHWIYVLKLLLCLVFKLCYWEGLVCEYKETNLKRFLWICWNDFSVEFGMEVSAFPLQTIHGLLSVAIRTVKPLFEMLLILYLKWVFFLDKKEEHESAGEHMFACCNYERGVWTSFTHSDLSQGWTLALI